MAGPISGARAKFEQAIRDHAAVLDPKAREALREMLADLDALATHNAYESAQRHKWVMHAYWRVVSVYARHFRRLAR